MISASEPSKKKIQVRGRTMAYVEMGEGRPIVFQHGNPTSSYLWRNVMPHVKDKGRCIALDLIGMGDSDKLENTGAASYSFTEHRKYLNAALEELGVRDNIVLVGHDWGSALVFDWANQRKIAVRGIAYMEAIVRPVTWDEWPEAIRALFQGFRSAAGEGMVLEKNIFVDKVLPGSVMRGLSDKELAVYRRPFLQPGEDRRPTLTWPRQIPISGKPAEVVQIVQSYADWMGENDIPKLFINAEPGAILVGAQREFCRGWKNQTEITVKGTHFIQEDSPDEIGQALKDWLDTL